MKCLVLLFISLGLAMSFPQPPYRDAEDLAMSFPRPPYRDAGDLAMSFPQPPYRDAGDLAMSFPRPPFRDAEDLENQKAGMSVTEFIAIDCSSRFHNL